MSRRGQLEDEFKRRAAKKEEVMMENYIHQSEFFPHHVTQSGCLRVCVCVCLCSFANTTIASD